MKSTAFALVLLSGCATVGGRGTWVPPACVTQCGARYWLRTNVAPTTCAELDHGEAVALGELASRAHVDAVKLCARLKDWSFQIGVDGYLTECTGRLTGLHAYEWGGLTHELGHVANNCSGYQARHTGALGGLEDWLVPNDIDYHKDWKTDGHQAAIDEAYAKWQSQAH